LNLPLIPKPQKLILRGKPYTLRSGASVFYPKEGERAARILQRLKGFTPAAENADVRFELDQAIEGEEAYSLDIRGDGVRICASSAAGLFYGAQTFRQLLPPAVEKEGLTNNIELPQLHIEDRPRFPHRGFMLDDARHFYDKEEIKRVIDLIALHKFNRFHWSLTNDQGWRIEIKKYPRLTQVGSVRKRTQVYGWLLAKPIFDEKPYGGFYTQDDIHEIVTYAGENFIEVIPEINSPGHATAAIASYPELSCSGESTEVESRVTVLSRPMCVGRETTFEFLKDVFVEVAGLFPYGFIHVGGDEVNKRPWRNCPHCQRRIKEEGLKTGADLQTYFENRLVKILQSQDSKVIAWSEVMNDNLDPAVVNQFWFFPARKKSIAGLKQGRKTIVSDASYLYMDYSYRVTELIKTYTFEPQFPQISDEQAANLIGIEAALWSEYVYSRNRLDWQMFPRLLAVSEVAWMEKSARDFHDFLTRLEKYEQRLETMGVHHATRECYLKYPSASKIPSLLKVLTREHPAITEYKQFHPGETRP
jgi:hexosaminidase